MITRTIKNITGIAAAVLLFFSGATAQNEIDAFRFSGDQLMGTARAIGVGGAFSAVGADFSSAFLNPAGLGLYNRSELEFTPHFRSVRTDADYIGYTGDASRVNLGFSNMGYVYHDEREDYSRGFQSFSFGLGFNQIANFHRNTDVTAFNEKNSITDFFAERANGTNVNTLIDENSYEGLAFYGYMIDTVAGSLTNYFGAAQGGNVAQRYRSAESGRLNEWDISFAANFRDRLYLGATLGIQEIRYRQELEYIEEDINDVHNTWNNDSIAFDNLVLQDNYSTRGSGMNLRVGLIYRPVDFFRLGVSIQTPTVLSLRDNYTTELTAQVDDDASVLGKDAVEGVYTYNLRTPFKLTTGAMVIIKKMGFITADFEMTDYTSSRFSADVNETSPFFYSFSDENTTINQMFDYAYNVRLGGEVRLGMFRLRGGYASYGAVINENYLLKTDFYSGNQEIYSGKKQYYTGGFGYKSQSFYLDIALVRGVSQDLINAYAYPGADGYYPELHRKNSSNNFILTTGFTF